MSYPIDTIINLNDIIQSNYIISSQHRRTGNVHKCKWIISYDEEVDCFIQTYSQNWKNEFEAWGLKLLADEIQVIGINNENEDFWSSYMNNIFSQKQV